MSQSRDIVQIDGFRELQRKLEKLGETRQTRRLLIPVLKSAARPTLKAAKREAPVSQAPHHRYSNGKIVATYEPGNLRKSLGVITVKDRKNASIIVAPRAGAKRKFDGYYAHMVHEGTVNQPANPFMERAFAQTKGQVSNDAARRTAKVVQRQINQLSLF